MNIDIRERSKLYVLDGSAERGPLEGCSGHLTERGSTLKVSFREDGSVVQARNSSSSWSKEVGISDRRGFRASALDPQRIALPLSEQIRVWGNKARFLAESGIFHNDEVVEVVEVVETE